MIPPVIPQDKLVIINFTAEGRAVVSRYVQVERFRFTVESAVNADQLARAARKAIEDQVGEPVEGHYPCPLALAEEAIWE